MTFWWCIGVVLVSGAVLAGSWCVQRFAGRFCLRRDAERREKYLNSVLWMLFSGTEECAHCPEAMSSRDRRLIAEDIADLVDSTYGLDPAPLRRIVERQRLDVFLLRRIRRNGGYRRAYYLHLLSRMPVDEKTVRAVERYTHSRNRYVRFCALSVQMMADMSALSSKIDAYSHRLSYFELSEVLRMLRQNVQPVDYEPLILSPNRNLRMLGLSVVWRFGIEDAEEIPAADRCRKPVRGVRRCDVRSLYAAQCDYASRSGKIRGRNESRSAQGTAALYCPAGILRERFAGIHS